MSLDQEVTNQTTILKRADYNHYSWITMSLFYDSPLKGLTRELKISIASRTLISKSAYEIISWKY